MTSVYCVVRISRVELASLVYKTRAKKPFRVYADILAIDYIRSCNHLHTLLRDRKSVWCNITYLIYTK